MTAQFEGFGVRFMYPENWELTKDPDPEFPQTVSVHSPTGAFWTATIHDDTVPPSELVDDLLDAIKAEYTDMEIEAEPIEFSIGERHISHAYELNFYCLDLLVTAIVFGIEFEDRVLTLLYQGESRDFDELVKVFNAMTLNMLQAGIQG